MCLSLRGIQDYLPLFVLIVFYSFGVRFGVRFRMPESSLFGICGKQPRLRLLRKHPGAVCLVTFAGKAISVLPDFGEQAKSVNCKSKLVLRYRQAVSIAFHGGFSCGLIRRIKRRILLARVSVGAGAKISARMLPDLPFPVPMKTKLRKPGGHVARLFLPKLNPYPLADNLTQFPKARRLVIEHVQNFWRRKSAIEKSLPEINPVQLFPALIALCGPVQEP
jgi:hypothetical protein